MCGIVGAISEKNKDSFMLASLLVIGLQSIQGRGQESAGISVSNGKRIKTYKKQGLVSEIFRQETITPLTGNIAVGQNRYSTTGGSVIENAQPVEKRGKYHVSVVHNGNIDSSKLRQEMISRRIKLSGDSDTELIASLIAHSNEKTIEQAVAETCNRICGSFSLLVLTAKKLIAVRDPKGIRPLFYGRAKTNEETIFMLASETCALDQMGAKNIKEVGAGTMLVFSSGKIISSKYLHGGSKVSFCVFEKIYLSRPDSILNGTPNEMFRHKLGKILFEENQILKKKLDIIVPIPDSGIASAIGFHSASGVSYGRGIIKTPQAKRLFIDPSSSVRISGVRLKLNVLKKLINGKRVGLVDDSIVRGSTSKEIVKMVREAGAKEIRIIVASPPVKHPCYYGIDMAKEEELIASKLDLPALEKYLGVEGVHYLSLDGLHRASGNTGFCSACFDNKYPVVFDCQRI